MNSDTAYRTRFFLDHIHPVDSFPRAATPSGVFNLFGNVAEWLEGPYPDGHHPDYQRIPDRHPVVGGFWDAHVIKKNVIGIPALRGTGADYAFMAFGFRCARTHEE